MKRLFRILSILVLSFCLVVSVMPNFIPSYYESTVSKTINSDRQTVFDYIVDLNNYPDYDAWLIDDSTITNSRGGKPGIGQRYYWVSKKNNPGIGRLETKAIYPHDSIHFVKRYRAPRIYETGINMNFESHGESTKITWTYREDSIPYMMRFYKYKVESEWEKKLNLGLEQIEQKLSD